MIAASLLTTLLFALVISIAAKPVLERKSPMKFPLTLRRNSYNYNVVGRDRRGDLSAYSTPDRTAYGIFTLGTPPSPCK